jgi:hypothetical protein
MGGTSYIHFKRDEKEFRVFVGGSAGDGGPDNLGTVPERTGWRGRLQFLLDNAEQPEDIPPEEIRVRGAEGVEVQMLALAWSGPCGAQAARSLLDLSEDALTRLADSKAILNCVDPYREIVELLDSDDAAILRAIQTALAAPSFEWGTALSEARRAAEECEQKTAADLAAREAALVPFAVDIQRLVKAWWALSGGARGVTHQWLMRARQGAVQRFLEDYLISHGAFPNGTHHLSFIFMNTGKLLDLDMDALLSNAPTTDLSHRKQFEE